MMMMESPPATEKKERLSILCQFLQSGTNVQKQCSGSISGSSSAGWSSHNHHGLNTNQNEHEAEKKSDDIFSQLLVSVDRYEFTSKDEDESHTTWFREEVKSRLCPRDHQAEESKTVFLVWLTSILNLFAELCTVEESVEDDLVLSVTNEAIFVDGIQLLIGLGVCPVLDKGLGIPIEQRLSSSSLSLLSSSNSHFYSSSLHRRNQLKLCAECLLKVYDSPTLRPLVVSRYLCDYLAMLFQLCRHDSSCPLWEERLLSLVRETFKPVLIRSLLALQKGTGPSNRPASQFSLGIGRLLSMSLQEPGGLGGLMQALPSHADVVSEIVCKCPTSMKRTPEKYFAKMCTQIIQIVRSTCGEVDWTLASVLIRLQKTCPAIVEDGVYQHLFRPLYALSMDFGSIELPNDEDFNLALNFVRRILTAKPTEAGSIFQEHENILIPLCLEMSIQLSELNNEKRDEMEETVCDLLLDGGMEQDNHVPNRILRILLQDSNIRETVRFSVQPAGLSLSQLEGKGMVEKSLGKRLWSLLRIIKLVSKKEPSVVVGVLEECVGVLAEGISHLHDEEVLVEKEKKSAVLHSNLVTAEFLEMVIQSCEDEILAQPRQLLLISHALLEKMCDAWNSASENLVSLIYGLISTVLLTATPQNKIEWKDEISSIRRALKRMKEGGAPVESLGEMLTSLVSEAVEEGKNGTGLEDALRDLNSPSPALKGHALIQIERLVCAGHHTLPAYGYNNLFNLLKVGVEDEDSYVYLSAIKAMKALCVREPDTGIPILLNFFLEESREPAFRVKIGQVLASLSPQLNELAPKYGEAMIPVLLCLASDKDDAVRTSSVSSLAELALCLSFKLNQFIHEMGYCVEKLLRFDKSAFVRRAAIHLARSLLQSSSNNLLQVMDDSMLGLYRLVRETYLKDEDDTVRLHAQLCLEDVRSNMSDSLIMSTPKQLLRSFLQK